MAEKFIKTSLATKLRLLFGAALLGVIVAALAVPWYFMDLLAEQAVEKSAAEVTRLRLHEWVRDHPKNPSARSEVAALYSKGGQIEGRAGPLMVILIGRPSDQRQLDPPGKQAKKAFERKAEKQFAVVGSEDDQGRTVYRCFRAVRAKGTCMRCHGESAKLKMQFQENQPVAMIDVSVPRGTAGGPLVWLTRGAFALGGILAGLLAYVLFAIITHRIILRPVRHLRKIAGKVAEGDLTVRSTIQTGDELQTLGESFNEMLAAIVDQHNKLRAANRALDLKLNELAEANVTLFHANKVKTEFLTNMSHELRTPLNSIIGFADLLVESQDQRTRRYGTNISTAAKNLLSMINDLLDLAKIEAGKAEVRMDKVSVTDACQTLVALMMPLADKKQLTLRAELADDLPLVVTDASKLQQIFYNLLSNAIKFTPAGGEVVVSSSKSQVKRAGETIEEVAVSIADTGPGIAEADEQRVFEKFHQVDGALTKESSGAGLGLAIARELANLLGGRLTLKSSAGHGAVFTLLLPVGISC